ncbi:MAG: cytochrome P450 [Flavobacteriales bacterium]|nr:cytochrome P450 [Flavobacteriales bacterium]
MSARIPKISGLRLLLVALRLLKKPLNTLQHLTLKKGSVIEFYAGKHQQLFLINDAEAIKYILKENKENFKRSPVIKALKPLLGNGIFISEDKDWAEQHKLLKPAFHDTIIKTYLEVVEQECSQLVDKWKTKKYLNIEPDIELLMLKILWKTQFVKDFEPDFQKIIVAQSTILEFTNIKTQKLNYFKKKLGLKGTLQSVDAEIDYLIALANEVIKFAKRNPQKAGYWLQKMILEEKSNLEMKDMILNFIFAGYDTTASALSWSLFALANQPLVQQKLRKENDESYLKMVIQEAMRLYPPVWSIHRQSEKADSFLGYHFGAKSYFMICVYTLHRQPGYWQKPNEFYPEHFLPENIKGKAFQYIPFGQGERICIGKPLAMMELQIVLPKLLQHFLFEIRSAEMPEIVPGIIMKSKKGIWLDLSYLS